MSELPFRKQIRPMAHPAVRGQGFAVFGADETVRKVAPAAPGTHR
jgi:hypothetical protein